METITKQLYEGMFLVDVAKASSDWDGVISAITKILERSEAEIVSIKKWDDRKLAYEIKGQSRGVYILCYFRVDGTKIQEIEKNMRLSEQVMRLLILNAELLTQADIDKETPAAKAEQEDIKSVEETQPAEESSEEKAPEADASKEAADAPEEETEQQEEVQDSKENESEQKPEEETKEGDDSQSDTGSEAEENKQV